MNILKILQRKSLPLFPASPSVQQTEECVIPQLSAQRSHPCTITRYLPPKGGRMIEPTAMAELVYKYIITQWKRKHGKPPIQADDSSFVTAPPSGLKIAQFDIGDRYPDPTRQHKQRFNEDRPSRSFKIPSHGCRTAKIKAVLSFPICVCPKMYGSLDAGVQDTFAVSDRCKPPARIFLQLSVDPRPFAYDKGPDRLIRYPKRRSHHDRTGRHGDRYRRTPRADDTKGRVRQNAPAPRRPSPHHYGHLRSKTNPAPSHCGKIPSDPLQTPA